MTAPAIEVHGLGKRFGDVVALDDLDLVIEAGTVFGLLGPNGAGKTTLVRILATLLAPTAGRASVLGHDVVREPLAVRRRIGLAGQFAAVDDELTGRENLEMIGRLSRLSSAEARARAGELLERFGLVDAAARRVATYSGGMRRRLDLAAGLIGRPPVILLDEPTTGLDPRSRQELWNAVEELRRAGTTVLLTTQYLEEADRACDRVGIIDQGRLVKVGSPAELKREVGEGRVLLTLADEDDRRRAADLVAACPPVARVEPRERGKPLVAYVHDVRASVPGIIQRLAEAAIEVTAVEQAQASLDDVFLRYTGSRPHSEAPIVGAVSGLFAAAHGRRRRP